MSETPVDLVKRLNKEFELALDALLIQSEATETTPVVYQTKEDLNQHLNKFVATARQLEPFLISAKAQFTSDSNQDIRREITELESESERKDVLLEKYAKKVAEWEKTMAQLQNNWKCD